MLKVFSPSDKIYMTNGDCVLHPLKAKVHKEDNGAFYLDLECPTSFSNYLQPNNIIVANTPQGDQAFRISNPEFTRTKVTIKANHIFTIPKII